MLSFQVRNQECVRPPRRVPNASTAAERTLTAPAPTSAASTAAPTSAATPTLWTDQRSPVQPLSPDRLPQNNSHRLTNQVCSPSFRKKNIVI